MQVEEHINEIMKQIFLIINGLNRNINYPLCGAKLQHNYQIL